MKVDGGKIFGNTDTGVPFQGFDLVSFGTFVLANCTSKYLRKSPMAMALTMSKTVRLQSDI